MLRSLTAAAAGLAAATATSSGSSSSLRGSASCAPGMFWVNYGNSPDQMFVSYTTSAKDNANVKWGTTQNGLSNTVGGNTTSYTFKSYTSPFIHHALLTGLPVDTPIYYQVGGPACGYSPTMSFRSHPGVNPAANITFAIIGDLGQTANSQDTVQHILDSTQVHAIIHAGDLSYADSDEPRWDSWQDLTSPLSSTIPWMTTVGNHEIEQNSGIASFLAYDNRFRMPDVYPGTPQQATQHYYSFEIGPVHWLFASSYDTFDSSSDQYAWIQADLAAVDRSKTPWVFAALHAPWYNSNTAHQQEGETMRVAVEPLFYAGGVDAVFAGHVHAYERNHRINNYKRDPKGPVYITIGDGGNREGLATDWMSPQPVWSNYRNASYGHGEVTVVNETHTLWSWHENPDLERVIADELWIVKGQDC